MQIPDKPKLPMLREEPIRLPWPCSSVLDSACSAIIFDYDLFVSVFMIGLLLRPRSDWVFIIFCWGGALVEHASSGARATRLPDSDAAEAESCVASEANIELAKSIVARMDASG